MTLTHQYTGATIKDLLKKFGTGPKGLYPQTWYEKETFFTESAPKGEYEIVLDKETCGKTYAEQVKEMRGIHILGLALTDVCHPAVLIEAILTHFEKTGERLLEGWWVRTSAVDSGGDRVRVGLFDGSGLLVNDYWDDFCNGRLGLSASVRLGDLKPGTLVPLETLSLEAAIKMVKDEGFTIVKII